MAKPMANNPEEALKKLQAQEEAQRAKFAAHRKSFLAAETKRNAAKKQWQEKRWQALGHVVEACLGKDVTTEALRAHLEQLLAAEQEKTDTL